MGRSGAFPVPTLAAMGLEPELAMARDASVLSERSSAAAESFLPSPDAVLAKRLPMLVLAELLLLLLGRRPPSSLSSLRVKAPSFFGEALISFSLASEGEVRAMNERPYLTKTKDS